MPLAAFTQTQQAPNWTNQPRVDRHSQEGDEISILFRATNHQDGVTSYSVTGNPSLPASTTGAPLTINATTGLLTGTLRESTAGTTNGAAGSYEITVTATTTGGSSSYVFTWDVSRFRKGDLFAGIGGGKYRVFSETGVFKYELTVDTLDDYADHAGRMRQAYIDAYGEAPTDQQLKEFSWGGGTTTGCGYNWVTKKMYFTSFDDDNDPSIEEVNTVPSGGVFPRARISTFRDGGETKGGPATGLAIDNAPESVVFGSEPGPDGRRGTADDISVMYVGHAGGYYNNDWWNADIDENPILEPADVDWMTFRYIDSTGTYLRDTSGNAIMYPQGVSLIGAPASNTALTGFLELWPGNPFTFGGNPVAAPKQWGRDIHKYVRNNTTGAWTRATTFDAHAGWQGTDWLDLAVDEAGNQNTLFYTSEWGVIYKYDVGAAPVGGVRQLAPFATVPRRPNTNEPEVFFALRLLPPGDGSGGVLVAAPWTIMRLNDSGQVVTTYDIFRWRDDEYNTTYDGLDGWFAINVTPDGRQMWSASTFNGRIYKWDIATGRQLPLGEGEGGADGLKSGAAVIQWDNEDSPTRKPIRYSLDGLCVMGEYTAAQEVCGNGQDDDGDGEIDENCTPIEACSLLSPGDDDGDGLVDTNDPDCGATNICAASGYTSDDVAGFCARFNYEGQSVSVSPAPGPPPQVQQVDQFTFTGLPPGLSADAQGVVSGSPQFTIVPNTAALPKQQTFPVTVQVRRFSTVTNQQIASYTQQFNWTIENVNRPPVASSHTHTIRPGQQQVQQVLVSDPDTEDALSITHGNPPNGTLAFVAGTRTFTYSAVAAYASPNPQVNQFQYTVSDGYGGTATGTITINVVNRAPVADDETYTTRPGTAITITDVLTGDTDPDAPPLPSSPDTLTVTGHSPLSPAQGTLSRTGNNFTYTPPPTFLGTVFFDYTVADGFGGTDTGRVTINVVNRPPVAVNDTATAKGTAPVAIPVLVNDSDPDFDAIAVVGASDPPHGTVTVNANGTITYKADPGYEGPDEFYYTIRDGFGGESTAKVTITVGPPNRFDPCTCSQAKASPALLWPPNHKKVEVVNITNLVDPATNQPLTVKILGIYQDEPTDYLGDGDTEIDGFGVGTSVASVRAERTGNPNVPGNGRVYEIVFEATAPDGSSCIGSVYTGVPHDQGQGNYVYDDGIRYDSTVAGGPIVRNALRVQSNLTDADVAAAGFVPKYVAQARIGGGSSVTEMQIGASLASPADTEHFTWTNGQSAIFLLWRNGRETHFKLFTNNQFEYVKYDVDCANGECNEIFLRGQAGGTGKITLSSLSINGLSVPDTITIPVGGAARWARLSGLMLDEGVLFGGVAKLEWTAPAPTGSALNFQIHVGKACPFEGGTGGGGGGTPPLAREDAYSTDEDTPLTVGAGTGLLMNDLTFGGALTASVTQAPSSGTVTVNGNGSFTYTPAPGFNGQDTFRYRVSDGFLMSEPAIVTITVHPVPDPPVAANDSATTNERTPVTIQVLTNDSDPTNGTMSIASATQPSNGTATISGTTIVYTPSTGFVGTDTFTYTMNGGEGSATATVTVTVVNVNDPPVAVNDAYTTAEDTPLTISTPGIKSNDSDPDPGDTFSASIVAQPPSGQGTVTVNANGSFTYTPAANFNGTTSFTYRVRDAGGLDSNVATVTITVTAVNDPPVAANDSYVVSEDGVLTLSSPGVKQNDSDPDTPAGSLTVTLVSATGRGTLTLNTDGSFSYTPFPNASGADSFVYRVSDGTATATATANIAITEVADPPQPADDAQTTPEDTAVTISVLGNDTDPDTTTLTVQSVTQPSNGTVALVSGLPRYTPRANFNGVDSFTYTVTDGGLTATAKVTITVTAVNDPPVAAPDVYSVQQGQVLNIQTPGVLTNDTDPDTGQQLTAQIATQPSSGTVVLQTGGSFAYTPNASFTGTDTFTYRVGDGQSFSAPVTVTITVTATNRPPVAANDSYITNKNTTLTQGAPGVLANDSDPDPNNTLTVVLISGTPASAGALTLNANGSFTFVPANNYIGTTTFRYRVRDQANAESNEAIGTIEVKDTATKGSVCYDGGASYPGVIARLDWETTQGGDIRMRATVSTNYTDNTYGITAIGWGSKKRDFKSVTNSDMGRFSMWDASGVKRLDFKVDFLGVKSGTQSGYGSLGVGSGQQADGGMVTGSASHILSATTSMDVNLNTYATSSSNHPLKTASPATNASYLPNALYPNWIWEHWYDVVVAKQAFGSAGFGSVRLVEIHASPSKVTVSWRQVNCQ